ncbi:hypothetical protein [Streptomyces sp. NPDC002346]
MLDLERALTLNECSSRAVLVDGLVEPLCEGVRTGGGVHQLEP